MCHTDCVSSAVQAKACQSLPPTRNPRPSSPHLHRVIWTTLTPSALMCSGETWRHMRDETCVVFLMVGWWVIPSQSTPSHFSGGRRRVCSGVHLLRQRRRLAHAGGGEHGKSTSSQLWHSRGGPAHSTWNRRQDHSCHRHDYSDGDGPHLHGAI